MTSIAIVGAGPQLGLAIARTFGSQGFDVALISRNREKLDGLVGKLAADGIAAAAFPADVLDRDALAQALKDAAARFGGIDVLEYSPVGSFGVTKLTAPAETEPSHVEFEMNFQLYGAIAATKAVLPAMQETGAGTLLYTTGAGSIWPDPRVANVNGAAAALRNWAMNLHKELDGTGIQAAHVGIDSSIGVSVIPGVEAAKPEQIAPSTGTCTPPSATRPSSSSASTPRASHAPDTAPAPLTRPLAGPRSRRGAPAPRRDSEPSSTGKARTPSVGRLSRPGQDGREGCVRHRRPGTHAPDLGHLRPGDEIAVDLRTLPARRLDLVNDRTRQTTQIGSHPQTVQPAGAARLQLLGQVLSAWSATRCMSSRLAPPAACTARPCPTVFT